MSKLEKKRQAVSPRSNQNNRPGKRQNVEQGGAEERGKDIQGLMDYLVEQGIEGPFSDRDVEIICKIKEKQDNVTKKIATGMIKWEKKASDGLLLSACLGGDETMKRHWLKEESMSV